MAISDAPTEGDLARMVVTSLRERIPRNWKATETFGPVSEPLRPDLEICIKAPDGRSARLVIEIKQVVERRDVASASERLRHMTMAQTAVPVLAARYLSASVREALGKQGLSYVDATGNIRVAIDEPAVFISGRGENRDPWRRGRPRGTLKGEPAARVTRALLDYRRDWTVRELMTVSDCSSGSAYRVLEHLEREDLVARNGKRYRVTDWERLLRAWSADAAFPTTTRTSAFIEPRGVDWFVRNLAEDESFQVAVTGSLAATEWAPYAPTRAVFAYVPSIQEASSRWGLRPNSAAPNIVLLEPRASNEVPFVNAVRSRAGYPVAAPAQVAADLLNGPGREPSEGEYLIEWMKANERVWRHD